MPSLPRIAVLVSGRGSNLQAILDAIAAGTLEAEIAGVFSDRPQARALQRVPPSLRWSREARTYPSREDFDADLLAAVAATRPDWVVCAGYLRILGDAFIARFRGCLLNIHPSLLPAYRGLRTHARALKDRVAEQRRQRARGALRSDHRGGSQGHQLRHPFQSSGRGVNKA